MRKTILKDRIFWLLLIFSAFYILGNIASGSLFTWDEAVYANVAREAAHTGRLFILYHCGKPWLDKPPLYIWCTVLFYRVLGVNEMTSRLTSGIFGIATILLVYVFVKAMNRRGAAIMAALLLLAAPHYLRFAKTAWLDATLTFFITLMIYLFWLGQERPRCLTWFGIALALGYFTKGSGVFLGPIIVFFYSIFSGKSRLLIKREFITGIALAVFIILAWHFAQYLAIGPQALDGLKLHSQRIGTVLDGHKGGFDFYVKAIYDKNKPWAVLFYAALIYVFWLAVRKKDRAAILVCAWSIGTFMIYTLMKTKLNWYILPVYPALAISAGIFLDSVFTGKTRYFILAVILSGMLIQVPFSYAFKLDDTPDVKTMAGHAKKIYDAGNEIYMIGGNDSELFYCPFVKVLDKNVYNSLIAQGKKSIYCIILPDLFNEKKTAYNFDYTPIYESKRTSLYRLTFKNVK